MKRLIILLVVMLIASITTAQDANESLVPFENNLFGVQGLVPETWQAAGAGIFARNPAEGDVTRLIIQSAPLARVALLGALRGQLGIEELPEPEGQIESDFASWDIYRVDLDVQDFKLTLSLAVSEFDAVTYIVILQTLRAENPVLHDSVFVPVVQSVSAIVEESLDLPYIEEEVTFTSGDLTLAGTLSLPADAGSFPAVVLISGSGASDRNESLVPVAEIKPFRDIADYLTRNGIAVLRYDERGVGESTGDIASATLQDFRDDASAAVDYLASRNEIDSSKIGIIGHSEGGMIAPEIALMNERVAFMIGLGAPAVPTIDFLLEQNRLLQLGFGATDEQIDRVLMAYSAAADAVLIGDEAILREAVIELMKAQLASGQPEGQKTELTEEQIELGIRQFTYPIIRSYIEYDPSIFWAELDVPILAIYGSLDMTVSAEQNIPALEALTSENPNAVIVTIESMNHIFQEAETGNIGEYGTLEQTVMPEFLDTMSKWILGNFGAR